VLVTKRYTDATNIPSYISVTTSEANNSDDACDIQGLALQQREKRKSMIQKPENDRRMLPLGTLALSHGNLSFTKN